MKKSFCDICKKEIQDDVVKNFGYTNTSSKLDCDSSANIHVNIGISLKNHSSGYSGSPDLCWSCFIKESQRALNVCVQFNLQKENIFTTNK